MGRTAEPDYWTQMPDHATAYHAALSACREAQKQTVVRQDRPIVCSPLVVRHGAWGCWVEGGARRRQTAHLHSSDGREGKSGWAPTQRLCRLQLSTEMRARATSTSGRQLMQVESSCSGVWTTFAAVTKTPGSAGISWRTGGLGIEVRARKLR